MAAFGRGVRLPGMGPPPGSTAPAAASPRPPAGPARPPVPRPVAPGVPRPPRPTGRGRPPPRPGPVGGPRGAPAARPGGRPAVRPGAPRGRRPIGRGVPRPPRPTGRGRPRPAGSLAGGGSSVAASAAASAGGSHFAGSSVAGGAAVLKAPRPRAPLPPRPPLPAAISRAASEEEGKSAISPSGVEVSGLAGSSVAGIGVGGGGGGGGGGGVAGGEYAVERVVKETTFRFRVEKYKRMGLKTKRDVCISGNALTVTFTKDSGAEQQYDCSSFTQLDDTGPADRGLSIVLNEGSTIKLEFETSHERALFTNIIRGLNQCAAMEITYFYGTLSKAEVASAMRTLIPALTEEEFESIYATVDGGRTGEVDFHEFFHLFSLQRDRVDFVEVPKMWGRLKESELEKERGPPAFLLAGELVQLTQDHVTFWCPVGSEERAVRGVLYLTNFRLYFKGYTQALELLARSNKPVFPVVDTPLCCLTRVDVVKDGSVVLQYKDQRTLRLAFDSSPEWVHGFVRNVKAFAFPGVEGVFAFSYAEEFRFDGWSLYDAEQEFRRQGLLSRDGLSPWRVFDDGFKLIPTYPKTLAVPSDFSDAALAEVATFRSRGRLPAVTYMHPNRSVMARSSQPLVGMSGHHSEADAALVDLLRTKGASGVPPDSAEFGPIYVVDARKRLAVVGNTVKGKGVEDQKYYNNMRVLFMNIENIHTMRNSQNQLGDICAPGALADDDPHFLSKVESSGWLRHVRWCLAGACRVAEIMELEQCSALIHCSDGWDRTAQLCAMAQMLLDPFFRTFHGFAVAVEKDWLSFGHKFQHRIGHGEDDPADQERSPVFVQWLEVIWQVMRQFPTAFEFNERFLIFIADELFSCRFGTFLLNNQAEREAAMLKSRTKSVWSYMLEHQDIFRNPAYTVIEEPLYPCVSPKRVVLWEKYYLRWDPRQFPPRGLDPFA